MGKSLQNDFSAPVKDIKLKSCIQSFLTMRNIYEKFDQRQGYLGHVGLLVWHGITPPPSSYNQHPL